MSGSKTPKCFAMAIGCMRRATQQRLSASPCALPNGKFACERCASDNPLCESGWPRSCVDQGDEATGRVRRHLVVGPALPALGRFATTVCKMAASIAGTLWKKATPKGGSGKACERGCVRPRNLRYFRESFPAHLRHVRAEWRARNTRPCLPPASTQSWVASPAPTD